MRFTKRRLLIYLAILVLAPLLTGAILLPTYPLRPSDRLAAGRALTAWALEGTPLLGSSVACDETRFLSQAKHILLVCEWLAKDQQLSADPRVQRATTREGRAQLETKAFDRTDYLVIHLKQATEFFLLVEVTPGVGSLEQLSYEVTIRRRFWGLEARVKVVKVP